MDDEEEDVGLGVEDLAGGGAATTRSCDNCGASSFYNSGLGDIVCLECGATSSEARVLTTEQYDGAAGVVGGGSGGGGRGRGAAVRRHLRVQRTTLLPAHHTFNVTDFLAACQCVLVLQCKQASCLACVPDAPVLAAAHAVWRRYVGKHAHSAAPIVHLIQGRLTVNGEVPYYARLAAEGLQPPPLPALSMTLLLGITYAACRSLCLPLHAGDLHRACSRGELTWSNAYGSLPEALQITLKLAAGFFTPGMPPPAASLDRSVEVLTRAVGLVATAPLNVPLCALSLARLSNLPDTLRAILLDLAALDAHDRAHAPAYVEYTRMHVGPGRVYKLRPVEDEITRIRSATNAESGANVAGLVVTAMTAHAYWRQWVDVHLAPGFVGGVGRSGGEGGSASAASHGAGGCVASTHDGGLAALALADSARLFQGLTAQHVSHATSHLLHGGDVLLGSGRDHEASRAYAGRAEVTVVDAALNKVLEELGQGRSLDESSTAALNADSKAALAASAKAEAAAGRAMTSSDLYALLMGSQATAYTQGGASQGPPASLSQRAAGGTSTSSHATAPRGPRSSQLYGEEGEDDDAARGDAQGPTTSWVEGDEEGGGGVVGRTVAVTLGPRGVQPGFDTAKHALWSKQHLADVRDHGTAMEQVVALLGGAADGGEGGRAGVERGGGSTPMEEEEDEEAKGQQEAVSPACPPAPVFISSSLQALALGGVMPVRPRLWQGAHLKIGEPGAFPTDAGRPSVACMRWQALVQHVSALAGVSAEDVATHCDGLTLLLQLYTPMPDKPKNVFAKREGRKRKAAHVQAET